MDKLIERLKEFQTVALVKGMNTSPILDAITALTQDRAVVLEEVADHFRKMAEGTVMGRGIIIDEVLSLKTPPATQAEPKLHERYKGTFGASKVHDTRNPAEADRRKSALGDPKGDMKGPRLYELGQGYGRRAGDRARWVEKAYTFDQTGEMVDHKIKLTTPPSQPAAEVEPWADWFMAYTDGKPFDWCAALRGDSQARLCLYAIIKRLDELDKRGVKT